MGAHNRRQSSLANHIAHFIVARSGIEREGDEVGDEGGYVGDEPVLAIASADPNSTPTHGIKMVLQPTREVLHAGAHL
jgi:hypothetical protein